jgi:S1-C subfamily serine protease
VDYVNEEGPAAKAGIRIGDVVRKIGDEAVADFAAFRRAVRASDPGKELRLAIEREGSELSVLVRVEARTWRR